MDVGPEGNRRALAQGEGLRIGEAGHVAESDINGHSDVWSQAVGAGHGSFEPYLLLDRGHPVDVPGVSQGGQVVEADQDGRHAGPIIQGLARHAVALELHQIAADGGQVPHLHPLADLFLGQPHVHEELLHPDDLLPLLGGEHVGRAAADDAGQRPSSVHHHLLAQEHPWINASHRGKVEKALLDLGDDEPDLVHVPGQHDLWPMVV